MTGIVYSRFDILKSTAEARKITLYKIALLILSVALIATLIAMFTISSKNPSCAGKSVRKEKKVQNAATNFTKLMICGGHLHSAPQTTFDSCEFYYPDKPELNEIVSQSFSIPRYWHTSQVVDGKVYIVGGKRCAAMKSTEIYDPQTETWTAGPQLNHGRIHLVSAVINNTMFVCGGSNPPDRGFLDSCEYLDQSRNNWIIHPEKLVHRLACAGGAVADGSLYIVGGIHKNDDNSEDMSARCQKMDLATGIWSDIAPLPTARDKMRAVEYKGTLVTCGGYTGDYINRCDRYIPEYDAWVPMPGMLDGLEDNSMVNFNGKLIALGGYGRGGDTRKVEIYNEETKTWSYTHELIEKRQAASVVML